MNQNLDFSELLRLMIGLAVSQQLAGVLAPYALIFIASLLGAGTALGNTPMPVARLVALKFFLRATITSLLFTVPIATLVAKYSPSWEAQWFFAPVAAVLAFVTDKWGKIAAFVADVASGMIRNWANRASSKNSNESEKP
jgi:hypothetical protein